MTNSINSYYANSAQGTAKRPQYRALTDDTFYISPDDEPNAQKTASGYDANFTDISTHSKLLDKFSGKAYQKSQSISGEVSQRRYERAVSSLTAKMQELMQTLPKTSLAYEWADILYGHFLNAQSTQVMSYDEIDANTIKLNGKTEHISARVQESKDKFINTLQTGAQSIGDELMSLQKEILKYSAHLTQMPVAAKQFFATFESAFGENEMQGIIDDIATIMAYGEYNAHHIKLNDGSIISWERDARGAMNIFINGEAIDTYLENTKLLKDSENFKALLAMLDERDEKNGEGVDIKEKLSEVDMSEMAEDMSEKLQAVRENLDKLGVMLRSNSKAEFAELVSAQMALNLGESLNSGANLKSQANLEMNFSENSTLQEKLGAIFSVNSTLQENSAAILSEHSGKNSRKNSKESPLKTLLQDI